MSNEFESWLKIEKEQGLKDIKFSIGGDTSNASVRTLNDEVVRLHKMASADITTKFPKADNYDINLNK